MRLRRYPSRLKRTLAVDVDADERVLDRDWKLRADPRQASMRRSEDLSLERRSGAGTRRVLRGLKDEDGCPRVVEGVAGMVGQSRSEVGERERCEVRDGVDG